MHEVKEISDVKLDTSLSVIKFWADWCMPCKSFSPTVEKLDSEFENVTFYSVNIDLTPQLAQKYQIKSLPTLVFLKGTDEVDRVLGMTKITPLRSKLKELENSLDI